MKSSPKNEINKSAINFQDLTMDDINRCFNKNKQIESKKVVKMHLLVLALFCGFIFSANYYSSKNKNLSKNSSIVSLDENKNTHSAKDVFNYLPVGSPLVNVDPKSLSLYENKIKLERIKEALIGINANQESLYLYDEKDINNIELLKNKLLEAERVDITDQEIQDVKQYITGLESLILKENYFADDIKHNKLAEEDLLSSISLIYNLIEKPNVLNDFRFNRDKTESELEEILKSGGMEVSAKMLLQQYNSNRLK